MPAEGEVPPHGTMVCTVKCDTEHQPLGEVVTHTSLRTILSCTTDLGVVRWVYYCTYTPWLQCTLGYPNLCVLKQWLKCLGWSHRLIYRVLLIEHTLIDTTLIEHSFSISDKQESTVPLFHFLHKINLCVTTFFMLEQLSSLRIQAQICSLPDSLVYSE